MDDINYDKLDSLILNSITKFPGGSFLNIYAGNIAEEAQKIDSKYPDKIAFQRIKELEKNEKIYQKSRQWYPGAMP